MNFKNLLTTKFELFSCSLLKKKTHLVLKFLIHYSNINSQFFYTFKRHLIFKMKKLFYFKQETFHFENEFGIQSSQYISYFYVNRLWNLVYVCWANYLYEHILGFKICGRIWKGFFFFFPLFGKSIHHNAWVNVGQSTMWVSNSNTARIGEWQVVLNQSFGTWVLIQHSMHGWEADRAMARWKKVDLGSCGNYLIYWSKFCKHTALIWDWFPR